MFSSADGKVNTEFEPTPAMATYTLAWMVSELQPVSNRDGSFRSFAQPGRRHELAASQDIGPQVLQVMARFTGVPYKLDKMDQVAVPDHNFGAMENWGLVTYRWSSIEGVKLIPCALKKGNVY